MTQASHAQGRLTLVNSLGLHARAAAAFVQVLQDFNVEGSVSWQGQTANGRSVLDLLTLGAPQGSVLEVRIEGADAERALATLNRLVNNRFNEE